MEHKIISYNVNGLKPHLRRNNVPDRLPLFLESFGGDVSIIALQETKLAKSELESHLAVVDGWCVWTWGASRAWDMLPHTCYPIQHRDSYFACCPSRQYAGVATFVRSAHSTPCWAEEGFTGASQMTTASATSSHHTPPPGWQEGLSALQQCYGRDQLQVWMCVGVGDRVCC